MHAFADGLKFTKDSFDNAAAGLGKGLHTIGSTAEQGVKSDDPSSQSNQDSPSHSVYTPHTSDPLPPAPTAPVLSSQPQVKSDPPPASAAHSSLLGTLTSGAGALLSPAADVAKSGASLAREAAGTGLSIGTNIARTGLDVGTDVATGTASLAGTALDNVVTSFETSGTVDSQPQFESDSPPTSIHSSLLGTLASGAGALLAPTVDIAKSGASLARDATGAGLSIGTKVARSGLDMGADVATGTVSLAGTALGGVVNAAAETSGAVFEPVSSGLKTLHGLDHLGQGVGVINGLSLDAVRKVKELTTKALNMIGKTPTFFDPDADGIVRVPDTVRGLVLLGLDEKNATYASYALHAVFSYSTSDSWLPAIDKTLPIHVSKMSSTRWGKNWGSFERLEWVSDIEIDKFFVSQKTKKGMYDYWKLGRQGFGILLLLFEWGTTWPFYMPTVHVGQIPFAHDIGTVVQKAILPTILSNFKKSREVNPQASNPLPAKVPEDPINMPGEFNS